MKKVLWPVGLVVFLAVMYVSLFVCVLVSLLRGIMGWSVITDCGIFLLHGSGGSRERVQGVPSNPSPPPVWERSGSVVECLTRDRGAASSSLTGVTALWSLKKTNLS